MEPIVILVSSDSNYLAQVEVLMTSIFYNNPGETIELYFMHAGISDQMLEPLANQCRGYGYPFHPVLVDDRIFANAPSTKRYPLAMYYRLLAGQLLPTWVKRVIYLDPDILVINPLRPLWETELAGCMLAAAAHTGKTELANNVNRLRLGTSHDYYNSGVLLMDLDICRKEIVPDEIFRYVSAHAKELLLPDQDILNVLYGDRIFSLDDAVWNYDARNYNTYFVASSGRCNMDWVIRNTAILHFCGKAKPWKPGYFYRFGVLYQHYAQITARAVQSK